jgi:hypothetical protein
VSPSSTIVSPSVAERDRRTAGDVVDQAEHAHDRGGVDRLLRGLVVEADVAAGDRRAQRHAALGQAADGLGELPHNLGVLGGTEVEAVGGGDRRRAGRGDVAAGLRQRKLRARERVEPGVAAVSVGGQRDAEPAVADAYDARVVGHG